MKLFYGSYDELLYKYYDCYDDAKKILQKDFTLTLLSSSVGDVEKLEQIWEKASDETILAKFRSGDLPVYGIVRQLFVQTASSKGDKVTEAVHGYFEDVVAPYVSKSRRDDLIAEFIDLIKADTTISDARRKTFIDSASSDGAEFGVWLADVFLYAILQDPPEAYAIENLPSRKNKFYVKRGTALREIRDAFKKADNIVCVSGMSGCGKTQLALAYAFEYAKNYKYICWIDAKTEGDIVRSINEFLPLTHTQRSNANDYYSAVRDFLSWCSTHSHWLLIYDNVQYGRTDSPYDISKFLPSSSKGDVLFATNNTLPYGDGVVLHLGVFSEASAIEYFKRRMNKRKTPVDVSALIERLGFLPKAIEEACAFLLANPGVTIREYLRLLDKRKFGFADSLIRDDRNKLTFYETTILNFERIASDDARMMLRLISYFPEAGFDMQIFNLIRFRPSSVESMPDSFRDEIGFYEILKELKTYSLCTQILAKDIRERQFAYFGNTKRLRCHKLTQEIVRDYFDQDGAAATLGLNLCCAITDECSVMSWAHYQVISDILTFLKNANQKLFDCMNHEVLVKTTRLLRFMIWALFDGDSEQGWLWERYIAFTEKTYGYKSAQTAYAYLEYFLAFNEQNYTNAFKRVNDAFLLMQDTAIFNCEFVHDDYHEHAGQLSLRFDGMKDSFSEGTSFLAIVSSVEYATTLAVENKDYVSAKKFKPLQRDWTVSLIEEFADMLREIDEWEGEDNEEVMPGKFIIQELLGTINNNFEQIINMQEEECNNKYVVPN